MAAWAGAGAAMQGVGALLEMLRKMQGRKDPSRAPDPMAGLYGAARDRMRTDLSGRPDRGLLKAQESSIRAPISEATRTAMDRAPTPGAAVSLRDAGGMRAASEVARGRADAYTGAASRASSTAGKLAGREAMERSVSDRAAASRSKLPTALQEILGGASGGFGDLANLSQSIGADEAQRKAKKNPGKGKAALGGLLEKLLGLLGGA